MTFANGLCRTIARNSLGSPMLPFCFKTMKTNGTYNKFFIHYLQRYLKMYLVLTYFNTDELTTFVTMFFKMYVLLLFKNSHLHFSLPLSPALETPTSHPQSYPLWLCPWVLYTCSLLILHILFPVMPLPSGYSQFVPYFNVWLYFACLFF